MRITIRQKKLSVSDYFEIKVDDDKLFKGERNFFSYKISLVNSDGQLLSEIHRKSLTELNASYEINLNDKKTFKFQIISRIKGIWSIESDEEKYMLYEHEGFNYSLYKGEKQIGKATKNDFVILGGDEFKIDLNSIENEVLAISIFLIIDNAYFIDRGFRFGYSTKLFKDGKARNWNWKPE